MTEHDARRKLELQKLNKAVTRRNRRIRILRHDKCMLEMLMDLLGRQLRYRLLAEDLCLSKEQRDEIQTTAARLFLGDIKGDKEPEGDEKDYPTEEVAGDVG